MLANVKVGGTRCNEILCF